MIRDVVARFIAGESLRSLTMWMDEQGIRAVFDKPWRLHRPSASLRVALQPWHLPCVLGRRPRAALIVGDESGVTGGDCHVGGSRRHDEVVGDNRV